MNYRGSTLDYSCDSILFLLWERYIKNKSLNFYHESCCQASWKNDSVTITFLLPFLFGIFFAFTCLVSFGGQSATEMTYFGKLFFPISSVKVNFSS